MKGTLSFARIVCAVIVLVGIPLRGTSSGQIATGLPPNVEAELVAVNLGEVEDFAFDSKGKLWVGLGRQGIVLRVDVPHTNKLFTVIDGDDPTQRPPTAVTGLGAAFGLAFDASGNLYIAEFDTGEVTKIAASLLSPAHFPIAADKIPPLTDGLGWVDGAAFARPWDPFLVGKTSPFGKNLFVGDIQDRGVYEIDRRGGGIVGFFDFNGRDIEEVIFSNTGRTMVAISPGAGEMYAIKAGQSRFKVLASGLTMVDAVAHGAPVWDSMLFVGELYGKTLWQVDPYTATRTKYCDLDIDGFEDIVFDKLDDMYILALGRGGQIIRLRTKFGLTQKPVMGRYIKKTKEMSNDEIF